PLPGALRDANTDMNTKTTSRDPSAILSRPTWSVRSLLPSSPSASTASRGGQQDEATTAITPQALHHLLRLSALPLPSTPEEEARMISTLQSQLRFVRDVQAVDTAGVEPLCAIRDETAAGLREQTVGVEQLRAELAAETVFGHSRRPRRRKDLGGARDEAAERAEDWDVLGTASRKAGRYFVVSSARQ
ncbi:MAG: aspartyl/glutamyl-tRNA amidotransferase subunit C, partial [Thaumarchaeota archaeon]|nr:aspartyl/glutamyl-tRNA amidotransferase subunit C [Nitrososphaerota archaeon]